MLKKLVLLLIKFYQAVLSPFLPASCRFTPSCSEYARQAVGRYGVLKGGWLGLKRLARCNPFNAGGYDPLR